MVIFGNTLACLNYYTCNLYSLSLLSKPRCSEGIYCLVTEDPDLAAQPLSVWKWLSFFKGEKTFSFQPLTLSAASRPFLTPFRIQSLHHKTQNPLLKFFPPQTYLAVFWQHISLHWTFLPGAWHQSPNEVINLQEWSGLMLALVPEARSRSRSSAARAEPGSGSHSRAANGQECTAWALLCQ